MYENIQRPAENHGKVRHYLSRDDRYSWVAIIAIMGILVLIFQSQSHYALSRNTISDNMSACLVFALNDISTLSKSMGTVGTEEFGFVEYNHLYRVFYYFSEFSRHHRTYATLHLRGTSVAELSDVSRYYHDLISSLGALILVREDSDSFNGIPVPILMEELRDDLRTLAHSLDQTTIASWSNHREASATLKALIPKLKLYNSFMQ